MEKTAAANGGATAKQSHVMVFPFPRHGHLSPMLQFAKRLVSKGLIVTVLVASSATETLTIDLPPSPSLRLKIISDFAESNGTATLTAYLRGFRAAVTRSLGDFIDQALTSSSDDEEEDQVRPSFVVYDSIMPYVQSIAAERGLESAPFFTQSAAVNCILDLANGGSVRLPAAENAAVSVPALPIVLEAADLPAFPDDPEVVVEMMTSQFCNLENVKWILFNTFDRLEPKVVNWMANKLPIKTVGPQIPSNYLDGRLKDDKAYGLNVLKFNNVKKPMEWLDSKATASVIYVSFGSLAKLVEEQVKELTNFLKHTNLFFLWVLRESELEKLPNNFEHETSERGLVVNWCCQLQVLSHKALSCFVTHCGWNSTLEALSLGVPMVAIPQWVDQTTNARFVEDVWEAGVRVKTDDKGIATKEELEASIRKVVREEFKLNAVKWKNLAKEAVDEGGSSDKNIEEFVKAIVTI